MTTTAFVFDPVAINTLKAKGLTFEATFSGFGNHWVGPWTNRRPSPSPGARDWKRSRIKLPAQKRESTLNQLQAKTAAKELPSLAEEK
jgi:hypothetical protein